MEKKLGNLFKGDKVVWMVFFFLCMVSIVEVFSASSNLTYKSQNYMGPIVYHTATIIAGVVVAVVTLNIPCRYFKLLTPFLLILTLVTLLWVLIGGESINGANRVISLMGFTFQPSEIAKGTMVLVTAQILSAMQRENGADRNAFRYILIVLLPIAALIGIENLSTAALLCAVIFLMMFIGRIPMQQLGRLMAVAVIAIAAFLTLVLTLGSIEGDRTEETHMTEVVNAAGEEEVDKDAIKGGGVFHRFATARRYLPRSSTSIRICRWRTPISPSSRRTSSARGLATPSNATTCRRPSVTLSMPSSSRRWASSVPPSSCSYMLCCSTALHA